MFAVIDDYILQATAAGDPAETASFASNVSCVAPVASSQSQQCTTPRTATTAPANNASVNLPVQSSFMPQILQAANGYMAFHNHRATPDAATPALSGAPRSGASRGGDVVPSASQTNTGTPLVGTSAPAMATGGPGLSATIAAMVGARQGRAAGRVLPAVPINPQVPTFNLTRARQSLLGLFILNCVLNICIRWY